MSSSEVFSLLRDERNKCTIDFLTSGRRDYMKFVLIQPEVVFVTVVTITQVALNYAGGRSFIGACWDRWRERLGRPGWREKREFSTTKRKRLPCYKLEAFAFWKRLKMPDEEKVRKKRLVLRKSIFVTVDAVFVVPTGYVHKLMSWHRSSIFCRHRFNLGFPCRRKLDSIIVKLHKTNPLEKEISKDEEIQVKYLF